MSRHLRVATDLDNLKAKGVLDNWQKDHDINEPQRVRWLIRLDELNEMYLHTKEAEAFVTGAKAGLTAKA